MRKFVMKDNLFTVIIVLVCMLAIVASGYLSTKSKQECVSTMSAAGKYTADEIDKVCNR